MKEFFILANSFAAPFFSDQSTHFQKAETPKEALKLFAKNYSHPCGLYSANAYKSAEAYHKGKNHLAQWLCNEAVFLKGKSGLIHKPMLGKVQINGVMHHIDAPKEGAVLKNEKKNT